MEQSIKNVEAIVNLALQRGAFRNIQEATEAINVVAQLRVEAKNLNCSLTDLKEENDKTERQCQELRKGVLELNLKVNSIQKQLDEALDSLMKAQEELNASKSATVTFDNKFKNYVTKAKPNPIPKQSELKQGCR